MDFKEIPKLSPCNKNAATTLLTTSSLRLRPSQSRISSETMGSKSTTVTYFEEDLLPSEGEDLINGAKVGGHHRPRIKLKPSTSLPPPFQPQPPSPPSSSRSKTTFSEAASHSKLLRPLTPDLIIIIALLTLGFNLLFISINTTIPGACASSIIINSSTSFPPLPSSEQSDSTQPPQPQSKPSSPLLLKNTQTDLLQDGSNLITSSKKDDIRLLNQLVSDLKQEQESLLQEQARTTTRTTTISNLYTNDNPTITIPTSNDAKVELDIDKRTFTNPVITISDNELVVEYNSKPAETNSLTEKNNDLKISEKVTPLNPSATQLSDSEVTYLHLRPLPHFTNNNDLTSAPTIKKGITIEDKELTGNSIINSDVEVDLPQGDQPLPYVDNKSEKEPLAVSKIAKSSKSKSKPSPPSDSEVTLIPNLTTPSPSILFPLPSSNSYHSSNLSTTILSGANNNNRIASLTKGSNSNTNSAPGSGINNSNNNNLKPRRLESLSYGIKNRIPNSIHFEDEEYNEEASSSLTKVITINANPSQNTKTKGNNVTIVSGGTASPFRRSALQIRRDLSRLVASAVTGNGIDDDIGSLSNKCDRLFISTPNGPRNGSFESPNLALEEGHLYQCILMFVTQPNERVEITFHEFNVRGTPPECVHEWVDIWTEVEGTDQTDLITTPFSGRYCGRIPPRKRISLYGGIAIGFYSDKNVTDETVFHGTYSFINESRYIVGTPVPRTLCSYTIQGGSHKGIGELLSPTYPGVYPKNLSCSYKFIGTAGQRIRIEFRDFDIFYGGAHCPFDDVKIYDGSDPTAPLIGTYCGQQRNLVVYSSENMMLVTFTTLDRNTDSQNRGFNAVYEFSNSFVKLDFIEKNMGDHIRGTECDQRILSKGRSNGVIYSPNYPFPYLPKIVCRYFIYGLQDPQNLERVRLSFDIFDVPSNTNSAEDEVNQSDAKRCGDGFLKVYLKGQEVIQAYDKADYEFCGKEIPHAVVSDGPRLVLVFSSGETQGSGFKSKYIFETEYRIPGTASPDGCHFTYYSTSRMKGEFNSPRFPSNYPSQTNCTYLFYVQNPNEQVRIVFDNFKLKADKFNYTDRGAYGTSCDEDWVEIWNVMSSSEDRLVGRYCGLTAPGPIESRERAVALKVLMHTDEEGVYSGFKARYVYFTAKTLFGDCGLNITQANSGVLTSPKWPGKYDGPQKGEGSSTCNWYLSVRPGSRVMLHFQQFAIEGEPAGRGCPAAAVRIWEDPDAVPVELCGEVLLVENSQYVSTRNTMRITFITADKAVGAPGFRAIWTEVQDGANGAVCHHSYFRCGRSQFCIPSDLRCDGTRNCGIFNGEPDSSDEEDCNKGGLEFGNMDLVFSVGVGIAVSLLLIIVLCAYGQRRKRRRRRRLQLRRPPIHVCDNAGARFAAMDSV